MNYLVHNRTQKNLNDSLLMDPETGRSTAIIKLNETIIKIYLTYDHSK